MDYLLEIGTEEIPSRFVDTLLAGLNKQFEMRLTQARIAFDAILTYGSYRRLAVVIQNIAATQAASTLTIKGPPVKIALTEQGDYTPAGLGFLKKNGQTSGAVVDGYLTLSIEQKANATPDVLGDLVLQSLQDLYLPIAMHWGHEPTSFIRPVHWIVSLLGDNVLPLSFAGQSADRLTYGHRFLSGGDTLEGQPVSLSAPSIYVETLRKASVLVAPKDREDSIVRQVHALYPDLSIDEELLIELTHLVEYPTLLEGHFEAPYLAIPEKILIITMKKHQKYIPVFKDGKLTNTFLITADNVTPTNAPTIIAGNERVVRARLSDARFYFEDDISKQAPFFLDKLASITYQQELGSISDKVARNLALALYLGHLTQLPLDQHKPLTELVTLSKFDLATHMVIEFTELQGYVGEQYALIWGISPAIAKGIAQHYRPAFAGDDLPESLLAKVASVADKVDSIVGHFAIGHIPSGSYDPYALRRQANGVIQILLETPDLTCDIKRLIEKALANLPLTTIPEETQSKLDEFFLQRLATLLRDRAIPQDIVAAVLTLDLPCLMKRLAALKLLQLDAPVFAKVVEAAVRVANITKAVTTTAVIAPQLFEHPIETTLWKTTQALQSAVQNNWDANFILSLGTIAKELSTYFEEVMVMANDPAVKANRLSVLKTLNSVFDQIADFKAIAL